MDHAYPDVHGFTPHAEGARLALCGNVFPAETAAAVFSALEGPIPAWVEGLRRRGYTGSLGLGLYFACDAARQFLHSDEKLARLSQDLCRLGLDVWTANAFPFGGFHGQRVKEKAFLPDWRSSERVAFTCSVARILAHLMMPDSVGSVSTCPLGYGPDARRSPAALNHLRTAQENLLLLEERTGVRLYLGLEPEPDGAFERIADLATWLREQLYPDVDPKDRRIGLCWDLCHSAVVGEGVEEAWQVVCETEVPIAKVQISSALQIQGPVDAAARQRLEELSGDAYFHQVRGNLADGRPCAFSDLPRFLEFPDHEVVEELRIHYHVPVHCQDYGDGFRATPWLQPMKFLQQAGIQDFELETYTLPVLPAAYLQGKGLVGTMVEESLVCGKHLGLLDPAATDGHSPS
ncbi:MAG: hypothetical protein DWQ01_22100 [Planctomycetota bacterium]|nr:MAG: hypothetical protein DWQ01_22100 [Planctomycetota bacterium]